MSGYSVLLESWSRLPHLDWGEEVAAIIGVHVQDAYTKLRRQQGIVWEGLDRERADNLGAFLLSHGYSAGLVADGDVVEIGIPDVIRNGDPVGTGFEIEDFFGHKTMIDAGTVALMQAGWVNGKIEIGSIPGEGAKFDLRGILDGTLDYSHKPETRPMGWILHFFQKGEPAACTRIVGMHFNYDYQGLIGGSKDERFALLLNDLAKVIPYKFLDYGYRISMGSSRTQHKGAIYDLLSEMLDRACWELTLKKVLG